MNTDRVIDVDAEVIALRNPRTESKGEFNHRAAQLYYEAHVAETVPTVGGVEASRYTTRTNHGSEVS